MSEIEIVRWLVFGIMGVAVWFMKRTIDRMEAGQLENKKNIQTIKDEYLHKADFREFKSELRGMFEEIRADIRTISTSNLICPKEK